MGTFLFINVALSFWPVLPQKIVPSNGHPEFKQHLLGGISYLGFLLLNGDSLGSQKVRVTK